MKLDTILINTLGYGAFAAWFAAIWIETIQKQLALTGFLMFALMIVICALGQANDESRKKEPKE